jgi:hypothetical protein
MFPEKRPYVCIQRIPVQFHSILEKICLLENPSSSSPVFAVQGCFSGRHAEVPCIPLTISAPPDNAWGNYVEACLGLARERDNLRWRLEIIGEPYANPRITGAANFSTSYSARLK